MNQKLKLLIALILFVMVIGGAGLAYALLSHQVPQESTAGLQNSGSSGQNDDTDQTAESDAQQSPDFEMFDSEGNTVKLSDFRGKPVVLNFWASWCPPCAGEMPDFEQAYQEYGSEVQFVMLNLTDGQRETVASAEAFISDQGYTLPVFFDTSGEGSLAFGVTSIPETVFIDRDGNIQEYQIGMIYKDTLLQNIAAIL